MRRRWLAAHGAAAHPGRAGVRRAPNLQLGACRTLNTLAKQGDAKQGLRALERSGIGPGALMPYEVLVEAGTTPEHVATALARRVRRSWRGRPRRTDWRPPTAALVDAFAIADAAPPQRDAKPLDRVRAAAHGARPGVSSLGGLPAAEPGLHRRRLRQLPAHGRADRGVTFVLLARAFRSLLLPLKAVVLNVLSVGAAWGVLTLVWQNGHGSQLIWGIPATGSITAWIPLMVFAFLFGLSMDYEVFILAACARSTTPPARPTQRSSRGSAAPAPRHQRGADPVPGLCLAGLRAGTEIKILATGLAAGILLDATVIRALLVPALVSLFGRWNWWLPRLPARMLRVEPSLPPARAAARAARSARGRSSPRRAPGPDARSPAPAPRRARRDR